MPCIKAYRDLRAFGLEFVTPEAVQFSALLQEIRNRTPTIGPRSLIGTETPAALLWNRSGKAIIALSYAWKYTRLDGGIRASRYSNLGSSMQMDVLTGRAGVSSDPFSFILPESKRLITENGMFGDNLDVLPPELASNRGGGLGWGHDRRMRRDLREDEITAIELALDVVFFEDGLCVGPDEIGLFKAVSEDIQQQRTVAQEIVEVLQRGESVGRVFEILRPLARHTRVVREHPSRLLSMFATTAIQHLVNSSDSELLTWFERSAQPSSISLRRPSDH
jgi:hypothetical protein